MSATLTQYGRQAERHWREHLPRMVRELEAGNRLQEALTEAEERTQDEMDQMERQMREQGLTPQQAYDSAWEIVRERYIFLTPE